jgi:regulator of sigma E protease
MPFQKGDTIHSVNGQALSTIDDLAEALLDSSRPTFVQYGSPVQDFIMPSGYTPENLYAALHLSQAPGLAVSVRPQSAAFEAGIQNGDCILRANDKPIYSLSNLRQAILPLDLGQELPLSLSRGDETIAIVVQPKLATAFHYGVAREVIEETVQANGPLHALTLGLSEASRMGLEVVRTLSRVLGGGIDSSNLGGIMTIGVITHSFAEQGWIPLLFFLCMISIHLGVLNLLPIPGLDGGHLMFLIYELLRGKPVSEQAQGMINLAGFLLVISMVIFVTTLDIQRFFS